MKENFPENCATLKNSIISAKIVKNNKKFPALFSFFPWFGADVVFVLDGNRGKKQFGSNRNTDLGKSKVSGVLRILSIISRKSRTTYFIDCDQKKRKEMENQTLEKKTIFVAKEIKILI